MSTLFRLSVVTVSEEIFSKNVSKFVATGVEGEFQVLAKHTPFLTTLVPGFMYYEDSTGERAGLVISGGIVEVQPWGVVVFADTVVRSDELDKDAVLLAKNSTLNALSAIKDQKSVSYVTLRTELLLASAKLRLIKEMKSWGNRKVT